MPTHKIGGTAHKWATITAMAYIVERPRQDGTTAYTVRWKERSTGKNDSLVVDTAEGAELVKRALDANRQTFAAAERIMAEVKVTGPSFQKVAEKHIGLLTKPGRDTLARYRSYLRNHTVLLNDRPVSAVRWEDMSAWIKDMQGRGKSAKTISNVHGFISAVFTTAVRLGHRADNPCEGVSLPQSEESHEPATFLTRAEYDKLDAALDPFWRPFFGFLVGTGCRLGEATALLADDFDLDGAQPSVRISKAWKSDGSGGYFVGPPKTKRSRRTVSLAPATVALIRPLVLRAKLSGGLVFTLKRGGVIRSGALYNRAWEPALDKAGLGKKPRIHDLRHSHASWCLAAGMDMFALSRRLGHESITTTYSVYSHLMPDALRDSAAIAERALGR